MKLSIQRFGVLFVILMLLGGGVDAQDPQSAWQYKSVHGYRMGLAVDTVLAPGVGEGKPDPRLAQAFTHHVLVKVRAPAGKTSRA